MHRNVRRFPAVADELGLAVETRGFPEGTRTAEDAARADADAVRTATTFPIGGVPPFGRAAPPPTMVDEDLLAFEVGWASAGTPHDVFSVPPADLARVTSATVAELRVTADG